MLKYGLTFHCSATGVATYKITTLKVLTFTNDFTCKTIILDARFCQLGYCLLNCMHRSRFHGHHPHRG